LATFYGKLTLSAKITLPNSKNALMNENARGESGREQNKNANATALAQPYTYTTQTYV